MAFPKLTNEQRAEALKKAAAARKARADFKEEIAAGGLSCKDAFEKARGDEVLGKMRAEQFIRSFPGMGKVTTARFMEQAGIAENKRVSGLGARQVEAIVAHIDKPAGDEN